MKQHTHPINVVETAMGNRAYQTVSPNPIGGQYPEVIYYPHAGSWPFSWFMGGEEHLTNPNLKWGPILDENVPHNIPKEVLRMHRDYLKGEGGLPSVGNGVDGKIS